MTEKSAPYLHLIRTIPADSVDGVDDAEGVVASAGAVDGAVPSSVAPAPAEAPAEAPVDGAVASLNQPLQQAIMHAAVAWVELMVERPVYAVDIQPVARRLYEVSVHYADTSDPATGGEASGEGIILRVRLEVEPGLLLRTVVEPVRP